jgi:hypothetical protein
MPAISAPAGETGNGAVAARGAISSTPETAASLLRHPRTLKTAALPARPPLPSPGVQPLLLVGQGTPCGFHSHEGSPGFLVFGSFGQEGAVSSIIAIKIR